MIKRIIQVLFAPIGGAVGYWLWKLVVSFLALFDFALWGWTEALCEIAFVSAMAVFGYFVGKPVSNWISAMLSRITKQSKEMPLKDMMLALAGLFIGFLGAFLLCQIFAKIDNELFVTCINALIYICCGFLGLRLALMRRDDLPEIIKTNDSEAVGAILIDTSVLVDGRIADVYKTGFLQGKLYIPQFVLDELSRLADSTDDKKRMRGRLGLDNAKKLGESDAVTIIDGGGADGESDERRLIASAKAMNASIMTVDYSLNMVASVEGVKILNLNELANAVKVQAVAGETVTVTVTKEGKEANQGVGYLDDGTMIVVEDGRRYIGLTVEAVVTSVLQSNSGKIVFAKIK